MNEMKVVGAMWKYIGKDVLGHTFKPILRSLTEMNPDNPPYPDTWSVVCKVYVKTEDTEE